VAGLQFCGQEDVPLLRFQCSALFIAVSKNNVNPPAGYADSHVFSQTTAATVLPKQFFEQLTYQLFFSPQKFHPIALMVMVITVR
jgi:hypothetical protein